MTSKELVSFMRYLKLTDDSTTCKIHNSKKRHFEVAELISITFDTTLKCLS